MAAGRATGREVGRGCWAAIGSRCYTLSAMWTVSGVLRALGLFVAELLSSITDWFQTKPQWANLRVLEDTELKTTGGGAFPLVFSVHERHRAKALWEKTGAVVMVVRRPGSLFCREEAAELSSLRSLLQDMEVPLFAVVKENFGKELDSFKKYFDGKVYVDQQRNFYGPVQRWMFLSSLLRFGVWKSLWRAYRRGYRGNLRGEGLILGGVFVIGPGDQVRSETATELCFICGLLYCFVSQGILLWQQKQQQVFFK